MCDLNTYVARARISNSVPVREQFLDNLCSIRRIRESPTHQRSCTFVVKGPQEEERGRRVSPSTCSSPISSTASSTPSMPSMDPVTQALSSKKRKTASTVSSRASTPLVPNSSVPGEAKAARKPRAKTNRPSSKARKHKKAAAAAAAKEEEITGEAAVSGSTSGTAESDPEEMVVDPGKDDFDDLALEDGVVQLESTVDGGELFFMDDVRMSMKEFSPFWNGLLLF